MIFLRAIPFSFSILWRYAIVLPLLIIAMIMFGIAAFLPVLVIGLIAPFLGVLVAAACGAAAGVVPIMVGTRVGLQAKRVRPSNTYLGLIIPSIGYGFFEALSVLLLLALSVGAFVLATPLGPDDIMGTDASGIWSIIFEASPMLSFGSLIVGFGLICSLRACLLMPLAGASIGADPSGRAHTPFFGIGSGFSSLLPLVVISQIGTAMVVPLVIALSVPLGIADSITTKITEIGDIASLSDITALGPEGAMFAGLCLFFFLFFFSLQCAGGVLVYMRHVRAEEQADDAYVQSIEDDLQPDQSAKPNIDAMELVRSRMQYRDRE